MPKRKEEEVFAPLGEKNSWHAYSLQMLQASKFTSVVGEILRGNYTLVLTKSTEEQDKRLN